MNKETKKMVALMYQDGYNPEDIADELGLDEVKVMDYCSEILGEL